jgi:hypothetical protein
MAEHLREMIEYLESRDKSQRVIGPFIQEQLVRSGERDVHFASMWLIEWLLYNASVGYRGAAEVPAKAPFALTLYDMISRSEQLSGLFIATANSLDYRPEVEADTRRQIEYLVPADFLRDAKP